MALPTLREPTLDAEPISPELVLVSPELREPALARARRFPTTVPRAATARPGVARGGAVAPPARRSRVQVFLLAAAGMAMTLATVTLLPTTREAPRLEAVTREAGGVQTPAPTRIGSVATMRPARERVQRARAATRATRSVVGTASRPATSTPASVAATTSRPGSPRPRRVRTPTVPPVSQRLVRTAERDVLNSPRFFIRLGARGTRFVDPATRLFRPGASIRCARLPDATGLSCIVRHGNTSLVILYLRTSTHSFRLALP